MDLEYHSHEQMIVHQCFTRDQIRSLDLAGKRILTMDDELLFVSAELKKELEDSSFKYLEFTELRTGARASGPSKEPLALTAVVRDLVDMLSRIRTSVDELARSAGVDQVPHYDTEASGFVYILGWYAIRELSLSDERRFSAELAGVFVKKMASENSEERILLMSKLLEGRIDFYSNALKRGEGRDRMARLIIQFMHFLGCDSEKNAGLYMALYASVPQHISALKGFLTGLSKTYKFV
jgi:hypothetical protein